MAAIQRERQIEEQAFDKRIEVIELNKRCVLLTGRSNPQLAQDIAHILSRHEIGKSVSNFDDGELNVLLPEDEDLLERHVIIVQPTSPPVNDHIMELLFMVDASRRESADEITAVIPYFGYSRQDRKDRPKVPISSSVVANLIQSAGADRIITVDIHSEQQQGFVEIPWVNLYASHCLLPAIKKEIPKDGLVVASPDKGGVTRATAFAKRLEASGVAIVFKERDVDIKNDSKALCMIGDVEGKDVLLVDDIIDTAGTLTNAANLLKKKGAQRILAAATHGLFTVDALNKISDSMIEKVFITDTINLPDEVRRHPKIEVVSIAPLLAEAIDRIETCGS